ILRIDVDNTSNGNNYAIPSDNPFVGSPTAMPEIWAYGLRNPWKFSFDRSTGDLWIADVGQNEFEEINMVVFTAAGENYGWRCYEGNAEYNQSGNCPPDNTLTFPIAEYSHNNDGLSKCSITGGFRYRGTAQPNLVGLYFFADYCSNEIGILQQSGANWTMTFTAPLPGNGWTTFGEDINGEIYIAGNSSDTVYKIVDSNLGIDENGTFAFKIFPNPVQDYFKIHAHTSIIESITIFDLHGKLISSSSNFQQPVITIDTKNLANGMYFIEVKNNEEIGRAS